jgi:ABC-type Mn2+/Zn2+ transport system permease subunit
MFPTFLPALACLAVFEDLRWSFWVAGLVGGLSALFGYLGSFLFSFPTGACMTMAAGGFLGLGYLIRAMRSK